MIVINAIIRQRSQDHVSVDVVKGCPGCDTHSCGTSGQARQIQLPFSADDAHSDRLRVGLRALDGARLLWHSWFLPLAGLLVAALAADWLAQGYFALPQAAGAADLLVFAGGAFGFGLGLCLCRCQPLEKVTISEVID